MICKWIGRLSAAALGMALALVPVTALAQQASGIAGVAKDTSGAVLPGVNVEASSPALIEKVRSAVTDGEGRYNITDLRPGTYVVSFTLSGFNTIRREGVVLTAGFTATVNGDMQVGALEETITVTGAAPLVDTQNVRQQKVVSNELLAALPTGSKALQNLVALTPGMNGTADVGGSSGLYRSNGPRAATFHGKGGVKVLFDNMNILSSAGNGASNGYLPNPVFAEESTVETGGISAESRSSGIVMNMVPKTGSNIFETNASFLGTKDSLQSDNLTADLRARGLTSTAKVLHLYDGNVSVGGPIKQDKLWFFTAGRLAGNQNSVVGVYFNATPHSPFYTSDLSRPGYRKEYIQSLGGRLTWQATQKTKVGGIADFQKFIDRGRGEFTDPVAAPNQYNLSPQGLFQVTVNSVRTSKLLFEAGASFAENRWPYASPGDGVFAVGANDINITELSNGFQYNAKQYYSNQTDQYRAAGRAGVSYVTGSHAFKGGVQLDEGIYNMEQEIHGDVNYTFLDRLPNGITEFATPYLVRERFLDLGLFAQDQWAIKRLTINYGLRFDYLNGRLPAQHLVATQFVPVARDFAPVSGLPDWKDLEPRAGVSYDLFGNGRTAIKASLGRYVEQMGAGIADANNPVVTSVLSTSRTWNASNGNYVPDCVLTDPAANGECGPISNVNFGKNNPNATRYDPAMLTGNRSYAWDFGAEVQHQLRPGISVTAGYDHNRAGNFRVTDNQAVTPTDFQPYCVTAPVDPRLPGGGGYQVCGLYDVAPAKFGQVSNLVTSASQSRYVTQTQAAGATYKVNCAVAGNLAGVAARGSGAPPCGTSDFISVSVNTRFGRGVQIGGGGDTGHTVTDNCLVINSPQQLLNCHVVAPFKAQTQVKAFGTYPLPADFTVSATLQNLSGAPFEANWNAPNDAIAPSLGRNLAACGTRVTCTATSVVPLIAPMTHFLPRRTQLDLRLTKALKLGARTRVQANLDVYNALNTSVILSYNSRYGSTWQRPVSDNLIGGVDPILPGRLIQLGGSLTF
jgi:hypothetical protein